MLPRSHAGSRIKTVLTIFALFSEKLDNVFFSSFFLSTLTPKMSASYFHYIQEKADRWDYRTEGNMQT